MNRHMKLLSGPTFVTKFINMDLAFAREFTKQKASIVSANFCSTPRYKNLVDAVRNGCQTLVIDPVTHAFTYMGYLDKATYKDLPYAPSQPFSTAYLSSKPAELRRFVERVLAFQADHKADILIAPYFYVRDLDDGRLNTNLTMLGEAQAIIRKTKSALPLYAMVCVGNATLGTAVTVDDLARLYLGQDVAGYFIMIENLDDRSASEQLLMGLAQLTRRLQQGRDVIVCSIGSFGQVLTCLGADAFSSGIGWMETFREVSLQPGRPRFPGDRPPRVRYYYMSELFSYISPRDLEVIFDKDHGSQTIQRYYKENCALYEPGSFPPSDVAEKRRHFLIRRTEEMTQIAQFKQEERPQHIKERIELAQELAEIMEEEALVRIPTEHFVRWLAVLNAMKKQSATKEPPLTEEELGRIIEQTRRDDDKGGS